MGGTLVQRPTGSRPPCGYRFWLVAILAAVAALAQACSDNTGPAGPSAQNGQTVPTTGHAATAGDIVVQVGINPNSITPGQRAGVTAFVTNTNGLPLAGKFVQFSTSAGSLDIVSGTTNSKGQFSTFLRVSADDVKNCACASAIVTAFVEGQTAKSDPVSFGTPPTPGTLVIIPAAVTKTFGATGVAPGACASIGGFVVQFTVTGGVPPYTFSTAATFGGTVSSSGLYTAPAVVPAVGGFTTTETVTVLDSKGASAFATITITCTASS